MKRILFSTALVLFAAPAWAADWVSDTTPPPLTTGPILVGEGISVQMDTTRYVAVNSSGAYVPGTQVNPDGTFKATCIGCSWRPKTAAEIAAGPASMANDPSTAQQWTPAVGATNNITGASAKIAIEGAEFSNKNGSKTSIQAGGIASQQGSSYTVVTPQGIATNGAVVANVIAAPTMITQGASGTTYNVGNTLDAHSALLSQHSATLEEHARGIAIAMALPDAWIESNKRFAIAGSVGGFGDETAIGAAAILRLDDVWSVNGKFGSDTSFEEFGWQVGARASW